MAASATIHNVILRRALIALAAMAVTLLLVLGSAALPAHAQSAPSGTTITVNTSPDVASSNGDCSLREAVVAANTNQATDACPAGSATGEDVIGFNPGSSGTTILGSQLPNISDVAGLVINGPKHLTGSNGGPRFRALRIDPGAKLALRNLYIDKFAVHMTDPAGGGAIYNERGTLEVTNSTIANNVAYGTRTDDGSGRGGAIHNQGTLKVTNSTIAGNEAEGDGGAINSDYESSGNPKPRLEVTNSTIADNEALGYGGGIFNVGPMTVTNSTLVGNYIRNGTGSNILNFDIDVAMIRNTILVVKNVDAGVSPWSSNCAGIVIDGGHNISDDESCRFDVGPGTSMANTDPQLDWQGINDGGIDNGGPTKTIALLPTSPAIDAIEQGVNGCATEITQDQRGVSRPLGPACDIGAFEAPLDVTAPAAPAIALPAEGSTLNTRSFSVSGTAEVNSTVELFEGTDSRGTDKTDLSGRWSIDLTGVTEGSHTYTAKAKDAAGNISAASNARTVKVDTTAPSVRRVVPQENAIGIAPAANVSTIFSEAMRAASINNAYKLYKKGSTTTLTATVTYDAATRRAVLNPSTNLERGATYRAVVSAGARDLGGNQLDQDPSVSGSQQKVWFFTISP